MPHYHIWTFGCQMNKAESERLASVFQEQGYRATAAAEEADIIVVNSCVVRQSAEDRAVNRLNALKPLKKANPDLILALTGCMVDSNPDQLKRDFPLVDYFFKPGESPQWLDAAVWEGTALAERLPASVYLPIIQGCDNFCSYCIVPYRRGRERSRPVDEISCQTREMVSRGAREIILLGQNVDSYGHDLPGKPELADLLGELNDIQGLARLRFLTNHPKDMSNRLIEAVAGLDKVCEQITLPVQSGDDEILKLMKRGYTADDYRRLIAKTRNGIPGVALSTDVIVGFPTETEEQFLNTYRLLSELQFDTVHTAVYSPRSGTAAASELEDNVPAAEKKRRLRAVEELLEKISTEINSRLMGRTVEILVEGRKKGKWRGRTRSDKLVFFRDDENRLGQLVNIRITETGAWSLQGYIEPDEEPE
ncbi:MAG: tRNA (N6-isopentenyl adenosine(37)-C2)-methylthiotransferase MiaB [Dehalococcoidales bacterium]